MNLGAHEVRGQCLGVGCLPSCAGSNIGIYWAILWQKKKKKIFFLKDWVSGRWERKFVEGKLGKRITFEM
jgi:hypothetical protein